MKTIFYDGVAALTDDEVADAVMRLATALAQYGQYESLVIPVLVDDRAETLTMMLGPTIHISILTSPPRDAVALPTAAGTVQEIERRLHVLTRSAGSSTPFEDETGPMFEAD